MKALLILALAGAASPAVAQHSGHGMPATSASAPDSTCTAEHAAMGHCTLPPAEPAADPHAGHEMPARDAPAVDPHAGHQMEGEAPAKSADPHAGHQVQAAPLPPRAPPPPEAGTGPEHAADTLFDPAQMATSREELRREHGDLPASRLFIERAETRIRKGRNGYLFDGHAWHGGDIDKLWLKAEVEGSWGKRPEHVEVQALWSHAIDPWFDLQTGVRYDPRSGPDRAHLVLGVQGLAPYWWEVDAALFLSNKGELTARAEAEYDLRITQQLILQPRAELDLSLQDVRELGIGAGLSQAAVGARLRYQVSPLVAPYLGVEYERTFGDTADFRRAEGEGAGGWNLLAGLRVWF